jgi:CxxC-x17-CxxC domain-containing protein
MMNDLVNLPKYNVYMKLMIDGMTSEAFSASTLSPLGPDAWEGNAETIIKNSRQRYSTPRNIIEEKIARWSEASSANVASAPKETGGFKPKKGTLSGDLGVLSYSQKPRAAERPPERKILVVSATGVVLNPDKELPKNNIAPSAAAPSVVQSKTAAPSTAAPSAAPAGNAPVAEDSRTWYEAVCQKCQKPISVPFKPDPARKTYCRECLREVRTIMQKEGIPGAAKTTYAKNTSEAMKPVEVKKEIKPQRPAERPIARPVVERPTPEKFISLAEAMNAKPVTFSTKKQTLAGKPIEAKKTGAVIEDGKDLREEDKKDDSPEIKKSREVGLGSIAQSGKIKPREKAKFE